MDIRVTAVGVAVVVVAGLSGCSSQDKTPKEVPASSGAAASSDTRVTIDGTDQKVEGTAVCSAMGGTTNIAIGGAATGIAAVLGAGDSVTSVGLGNVNGVTLAVAPGVGEAKAVKDGKTYTISGTATGADMANPMQPVNKPFEIRVTCP